MPVITQNRNQQAGLVKAAPTADLPVPLESARISSPAFRGVAVDLKWVNRTDLLTNIAGSSWVLKDYYSQVLDTDSQLSGQQLTVSGAYQQYRKIKLMEMKVQQPLSTSQTDQTKGMNLEGSSVVYPFLIPNEGDMFTADIGEGKIGVFRVNLTTKKSIFKEACYEIAYQLDTDQDDKRADLDAKTIETYVFWKDNLAIGKNPLLLTTQHQALLTVGEAYEVLCKQYFKRFFSNEYCTMLVPGQLLSTYDHFIVDFLLKMNLTDDCPEIRYVKELAVEGYPAMQMPSIWTALLERNAVWLKTAFKQAGAVPTVIFSAIPLVNSIRYTGIKMAMMPTDADLVTDVFLQERNCPVPASPLDQGPAPMGGMYRMVQAVNIAQVDGDAEGTIKPIDPNYYVFSQAFYERSDNLSTLEGVVWQFLEREPMDVESLVATADLWPTWGLLEQFYYIPVLMCLMRSILMGEGQ